MNIVALYLRPMIYEHAFLITLSNVVLAHWNKMKNTKETQEVAWIVFLNFLKAFRKQSLVKHKHKCWIVNTFLSKQEETFESKQKVLRTFKVNPRS